MSQLCLSTAVTSTSHFPCSTHMCPKPPCALSPRNEFWIIHLENACVPTVHLRVSLKVSQSLTIHVATWRKLGLDSWNKRSQGWRIVGKHWDTASVSRRESQALKTAREVKQPSWFCQNITRECSSGAKHLFTMGKALGTTTALRKKKINTKKKMKEGNWGGKRM